ncbi:hypothetical protein EWE74_19275 [Sphingobacterium corticibacterium]|uniref:Uncharacterized protein n=1 Tax=Sphingobacterium corticibacterium TaxID=2484746 RepID=A0A4Q6XGM3_9SPHI|nr:hypothetical protein EWE74_19275 [Sphingobacterium corticibacterium]
MCSLFFLRFLLLFFGFFLGEFLFLFFCFCLFFLLFGYQFFQFTDFAALLVAIVRKRFSII